MPLDRLDWTAIILSVVMWILGGFAGLAGTYCKDWNLVTVGLTGVLVGTTIWYAREARTGRVIDKRLNEIFEVYSPLIDIVEYEILRYHCEYAPSVAPALSSRLKHWRLPDDTLNEYNEIRQGTKDQNKLKNAAEVDLVKQVVLFVVEAGASQDQANEVRQMVDNFRGTLVQRQIPEQTKVEIYLEARRVFENLFSQQDWYLVFHRACQSSMDESKAFIEFTNSRRAFIERVAKFRKDLYNIRTKLAHNVIEVTREPPSGIRPTSEASPTELRD